MKRKGIILISVFIFMGAFSVTLVSRPLIEELKTGSLEQQIAAMHYFGYSKNKRVFWYLVKNLDRTFDKDDKNTWGQKFRQVAAESLGRLGDTRAVSFLIKRYKVEKKNIVKKAIIFGLGYYKEKDIISVVKDGLKSDNNDVIGEAMKTAARLGDKSVAAEIKSIQGKSENQSIKLLSSYALIRLDEDMAANSRYLRNELSNKSPAMRFWSAHFLSMTDRTDAIEDLIKALEIENYPWVQKEMEHALAMLYKKKRDSEYYY